MYSHEGSHPRRPGQDLSPSNPELGCPPEVDGARKKHRRRAVVVALRLSKARSAETGTNFETEGVGRRWRFQRVLLHFSEYGHDGDVLFDETTTILGGPGLHL